MKKRLFGILLSFAMMLTMMPVLGLSLTAYAATGGNIPGTNLTWELSDTGTLTIDGTGNMPDYESDPPWKTYKDQIKSIVIKDGVTRIGKSAFSKSMGYCTDNLTEVTIPSSVTSIGGDVFNQCSGITNVSLGCSVIGEGMFQSCSGLTQITIPSNVTSINNDAFNNCTNLEKVTFTPAEEGKTLSIGHSFYGTNAKVAYGTGSTRLYDGDTEIQANASLSSYNNKTLTWKPAAPVTEYPLWVGGVQVTSANMSGDGWSYTPATTEGGSTTPATLTLNGYSYNGEGHKGSDYTGGIFANEPLIIDLNGENSVICESNAGDMNCGIYSASVINISGEGSLKVTVTSEKAANGILSHSGGINIADGEVEATGTSENKEAYGIVAFNGGITINKGKVTAKATSKASNVSNYTSGIATSKTITIGSDITSVIAEGTKYAVLGNGTVKNAIAGTGWTNTAGTEGETAIGVSATGQHLTNYKRVQFPAEVVKVTVKFDSAGGSAVKAQTINKGAEATKPADPTKDGYTFDGWYLGSTAFDFSTAVNEDITLVAHWKKNSTPTGQSTITYDLNGGTWDGMTGIVTLEVENGEVITLPAPTRDGYTFDYWEGSKYNAGDQYTVNGDHTFKAIWKTGAGGDGSKGGSSKKGVNTGDENTLGAWIVLLVAALTGTTGMVFARKRRND